MFGKALALDPGLAAAHRGMARVSTYLFSLGVDESSDRIATAIEEAREAVARADADAASHAALAMALLAADRLTPALTEARRAVALDPGASEAQIALASVLRLRRELDASLEACHRAAEIEPDSPRILTTLGETLREAGRYREAMEMFGQAIDLDHEAILPQLGAAATLLKAGSGPGARNLFEFILDTWDYGQNRVRLGEAAALVTTQEYEAALGVYARIEIPENGSLPSLLALYGKGFCLLQLGRDAEAEYFLSRILERAPDDYDGPARGREIVFQAYDDLIGYFEKKGRDRKVDALARSACSRPLAPTRFARRLAARLEARGKPEEAAVWLEKAIAGSDPLEDPLELSDSALALSRLRSAAGKRRMAEGSAWAGALRLAAERIASCPFGIAHYRLARAQSLARDIDAAIASLEQARNGGYLPPDRLAEEGDFEPLRKEPAFQALLGR